MARSLSAHDAERLLSGQAGPDDLPEAAGVARLFTSMRDLSVTSDPNREREVIAGIASEIRAGSSAEPVSLARARGRRMSTKATAIAFAAVLASGTAAAAAANGSLPSGVQRVVANALAHVNISVPNPSHHTKLHPSVPAPHGSRTGHDSTPANANGPKTIPPGREGNPGANKGKGNTARSTTTLAKGKGNSTHTTPTTPAKGNGKGNGNTTHTTPTTPANANANGKGKGKGKGNANGNANTTHTTPTTPANGNGNGNGNANTAHTTPTTPANGNGNGNGNATHTTPTTPAKGNGKN